MMIGTDANASCAMIDCAYGCEEKSEKEENRDGEREESPRAEISIYKPKNSFFNICFD